MINRKIDSPTQEDCMDCYISYQKDKSFNRECSIYQENKDIYDKCIWIDSIDKELDIFLSYNEVIINKLINHTNKPEV